MAAQANPIDQSTRQRAEKGIERLRDEYMDVLFRRPDELPDANETMVAMGFPSADILLSDIGELAARRVPEPRRPMPTQADRATRTGAAAAAQPETGPAAAAPVARVPQRQSYLSMVEAIVKEHAANQSREQNRQPAA